jgi:phosphate transport system substrate-binding protein
MKIKFNLVSFVAIVVAFTIGAFTFSSISNSAQAKSSTKIELWVNKPQARVNGAMKWIDDSNKSVTPIIQWSRTMLPLRFIAENMGFSVDWDAKESKATVSDSGELSGTLTEAGSTSVLPLAEKFSLAFMKKHPKVRISYTGGGSSAGVKQVIAGTVNIGAASRDIKMSEADLYCHIVARDGVAVIVHKNQGINGLTLEQVAKIFAGEITDWKEIGGPAGRINVYAREEGSGTRDCFDEMVLAKFGKKLSPAIMTKKSNGEMQMSVQSDKSGIAYVSLGYMDGVKALMIDGKEPSVENCQKGIYPVVRRLYFLTKDTNNALTNAFMDFCRSTEGQQIVKSEGFIPIVK